MSIEFKILITPECDAYAAAAAARMSKLNIEQLIANLDPLLNDLFKVLEVQSNLTQLNELYEIRTQLLAVHAKLTEIDTLASIEVQITDLHTNLGALLALFAKLTELLAVHAKLSEVEAVYSKLNELAAIHAQLANLLSIYNNLSVILSLQTNLSAVNAVNNALSAVNAVSASIEKVNTVAYDINAVKLAADEIEQIKAAPSAANLARAYAESPTDVPVEEGKFSAKHHAAKAKASEDIAIAQAAIAVQQAEKTAADALQTTEDREQTTLDRIATGEDVIATALSESNAAASAVMAEKWAENPEDVEVEDGKYSAKHFALKAEKLVPLFQDGYWYGIDIDNNTLAVDSVRTGNGDLHRSLPIQSKMYTCLLQDNGTESYKLHPTDWSQKLQGGASKLDGTDGQVMVWIPDFYWKFETVLTVDRIKLSEFALPDYNFFKGRYVSAFEASLLRTSPNKLSSLINLSADYRGGSNTSAWDAQANTMLGRPATSISRTNFTTFARNRGAGWEAYHYYAHWALTLLFVVEYATTNSQKAVNTALDANGYRQGGLGAGVTTINSARWGHFTGYNPLIPCGASNALASGSGEVLYTMPFEFDCIPPTFVNLYSAATAYTVGQYTSSGNILYRCIANSTGNAPTNTDFWTPVSLFKGVYDAGTTYQPDDFVTSGALLYRCTAPSTGNAVTNTSFFSAITRTTQAVNRYRGIEMPFGHIWKWADGINVRIGANSDADPTSKVYVSDVPAHWNASNYTNYILAGELPRANGYIKEMIPGHVMPRIAGTAGTGSASYWPDYFYTSLPSSGESLRGVLFGGLANESAFAGFGSSPTSFAPSHSGATFGSRLCFLPA